MPAVTNPGTMAMMATSRVTAGVLTVILPPTADGALQDLDERVVP
jgi:hypothetical protein